MLNNSVLIFCFFLWLPCLSAQVCTGNLGDNIFLEGDFGAGAANLLSPNPNIAPGYAYTFNVPPVDGQYVLTNNTAVWSNLYSAWLPIGDNSPDPNGYMMVVNGSFEPGLFYEQVVDELCGNTLYEFSADVINLIRTNVTDHIKPNVSFLLDGVVLFSTGNIPQDETWTTYGFTFTTNPGQETVVLSLRNNAPGGNGNDLAIDNISFRACGPTALILPDEIANICEDGSPILLEATVVGTQYVNPAYQWQQSPDGGITWVDIAGATGATYLHNDLNGGAYFYRFLLADGMANLGSEKCRVNSNVKIVNVIPKEYMVADTICEGQTLIVGNSVYSVSGVYTDSLMSFFGCDSILTTDLTVLEDAGILADIAVTMPSCFGVDDGSINISAVTNGVAPYQYFFEGIDFGAVNFYSDLAGGTTYNIVISDAIGCSSSLDLFINDRPELLLELGENQLVELGQSVEITPAYNFSVADFSWEAEMPVICDNFEDCQTITFLPINSQQVSLTLFDEMGCRVSDSLLIEIIDVRNLYFPNVFSPNNDGINDVFMPFGILPNVEFIEELKVFNRWGGLVYEGSNFLPNDQQYGWNGIFNGKEVPAGIYVYIASVRFLDNVVLQYSGDVLLMR